jgi:cytochrome c-type biogenesis protein CcmH/NrfF
MIRRILAATLVCAATVSSAGLLLSARAQDDRAHQVGKKVKCMCGGCNDSAGTCFHTGGSFSGPCNTAKAMLKQIDQQIAHGDSDDLIVQSFVQQYGQVVLTEPPHTGFGSVAWAMPVVYMVVGTVLVLLIIMKWRKREVALVQAAGSGPAMTVSPEALEQARRRVAQETED